MKTLIAALFVLLATAGSAWATGGMGDCGSQCESMCMGSAPGNEYGACFSACLSQCTKTCRSCHTDMGKVDILRKSPIVKADLLGPAWQVPRTEPFAQDGQEGL